METPTFKDIADLHEYVFQLLLKEHEKDNAFLFTLRKPEDFTEETKNHWFYGGDDYITFSFWDFEETKTSIKSEIIHTKNYIQFTVNILGKVDLCITDDIYLILERESQYSDKRYFLDFTKSKQDIREKRLSKLSLDTIVGYKDLIDSNLYTYNLGRINPREMDRCLINIYERRKKQSELNNSSEGHNAKVEFLFPILQPQSLSLKNISHFSALEIDLSHRITCIIGENGSGKSSILKAIALSLVGTDKKIINASHRSLVNLLKIIGLDVKSGEKELALAGEIALTYNEKYRNAIHFQFEYGDLTIKDEGDFENIHNTYYFPHLILAFPQLQGKNENGNVRSLIEQAKPNIKDVRALIYGEAENPFEKLESWIAGLYGKGNTKEREKSTEHAIIAQLFEIISAVTGADVRFITVVYEGENQIVWVSTPDAPNGIPLSLISQGYSNVFGWIGYFMKRLAEVNRDAEDFTQCPAIVLIDEIDTYLHPKWQETILRILADKFPQTQFIVTTHSPFVISSVKHSDMCIYSLESKGNEMICREIEENVYGADRNTSAEVLGTKERLQEPLDKINTLFNLIYDNSLLEAENYLQTQFTDMNLEDEELQKAKKLIDTKKRLLQR